MDEEQKAREAKCTKYKGLCKGLSVSWHTGDTNCKPSLDASANGCRAFVVSATCSNWDVLEVWIHRSEAVILSVLATFRSTIIFFFF